APIRGMMPSKSCSESPSHVRIRPSSPAEIEQCNGLMIRTSCPRLRPLSARRRVLYRVRFVENIPSFMTHRYIQAPTSAGDKTIDNEHQQTTNQPGHCNQHTPTTCISPIRFLCPTTPACRTGIVLNRCSHRRG